MIRNVLALADILIKFNKFAMENFQLSIFHSCSLRSYAFDACFSSISEPYEYIKDIEMIRYLQKAVRSGPCMSVIRRIDANCERLGCFNNKPQERAEILVLDENNMYANALTGYLGISSYTWMTENELQELIIENINEDDDWGYIITADLIYEESLHDRDIMLPLCVTKRIISTDELSYAQQSAYEFHHSDLFEMFSNEKLVLDVNNKSEYTCYGPTLKYYKAKGIQIKNISKGIKFRQSPFLRCFFKRVLQLRKTAKQSNDDIASLLFKGILNRIFGVMLSNTEKYTDTKFVFSEIDAVKLLSSHNFVDYYVLNELHGSCIFKMKRGTIHYRFPMIPSLIALDRAKHSLYSAWDNIVNTFGKRSKLCYSDTDSIAALVYVPKNDFYEKLRRMSFMLDLSTLPDNYPLYDTENEMKPGFWKMLVLLDALSIISLRPKAYFVLRKGVKCGNSGEYNCYCSTMKKASGIPCHLTRKINHDFFIRILNSSDPENINLSKSLVSVSHNVALVNDRSFSFHCLNPRRYMVEKVNSLPLGHWRIENGEFAGIF
jgi:hypothetical protein